MKHEDKALKNILQGKKVEKKIQVGGYDKEFSEKMKKEREEEKKRTKAISKIMSEIRMPMFCPKCQCVMTKRLDKKFWMKGFKSCFNCVQKEESKIRIKGPEAWKEYENKKVKSNAMSWLRDQEVQFNEWKDLIMLGGETIISDDKGTQEKWKQSKEEAKALVDKMEIEFNNMKKELLEEIDSNYNSN